MRKVIPVLLGILLLFTLSACNRGGEGTPAVPNATAGASGEKTEATQESVQETVFVPEEDYVAKITVQINPVFEIYIDANGKVVAVHFGNSDAREVGKGLSFKDLTVQETIQTLLQASNEKGYFAEEARPVEIQISASDASLPDGMSDALRLGTLQTVVAFTDEENVGLELRLKMWDKTAVDTVIKDGKAEELPNGITFDGDAKTTTETTTLDNGGTCIKTYDSQYRLISEKSTFPGLWTAELCFENGVLTKEIMDTVEGNHTVTHYWPDGTVKATDHQGADGRILNCEYNEKGNLIWSYEVMPDGYAMEQEYRDDGTLLKGIDTFPDGVIETTYNERGDMILQLVDRAEDETQRIEYSYSGSTLSSVVTYLREGASLEKLVITYSGATQTHTEYYRNGGKIIRTYDANGNTLSEAFYDAAGKAYNTIDDWSAHMNW